MNKTFWKKTEPLNYFLLIALLLGFLLVLRYNDYVHNFILDLTRSQIKPIGDFLTGK